MGQTYLNYGWVLLTALYKFVIRELRVLVSVHISKYLVYALGRQGQVRVRPLAVIEDLFGRVFVSGEIDHLTSHLVDGSDDLKHLVVGDEAVLVYVIELECPCRRAVRQWTMRRMRHTFELFVQASATRYAEGADELLKVDRTVLVLVKDVEYIVCELAGVTKGEELLVYATELGSVEVARRTIPEEALVPRAASERCGGERGRRDHCCSSLLSTGEMDECRWRSHRAR